MYTYVYVVNMYHNKNIYIHKIIEENEEYNQRILYIYI